MTGRRPPAIVVRACALAAALALSSAARAQVVDVQAGSSSLFDANGGSIGIRTLNSGVTVGLGELQGRPAVGFLFEHVMGPVRLKVGDAFVDLQLPTDIASGARYLPVRGAGAQVLRGRSTFHLFAGTTSKGVGSPFFQGATWGQLTGLFFADVPRGEHWRFVSRNAVTEHVTSIHSAEWRNGEAIAVAASGGVGADHLYAASSLTIEQPWITARTGYAAKAADFRRIDIDAPAAAEVEREHLSITLRPRPSWSLSAGRQHLADTALAPSVVRRASVNQLGGSLNLRGNRVNATVFDATRDGARNLGLSTTAGRRIGRGVDVGVDYFRDHSAGVITQSIGGRVQEPVHPRINLLEVANYDGRNWSFNAGGQFLSNALTLNVGYQTTYAPFRSPNPFVRAIAVDVRMQVLGIEMLAGTYVTPDGHVRYTVRGRRFLYRRGGAPSARSFEMGAYVVRGIVKDEQGRPVEGVILQVDEETVISDREGRFYVRAKKPRTATLRVRTEDATVPGSVEIITAPSRTPFAADESANDVTIVVRLSRGRF